MRTPYYESTIHRQIREKRENRRDRIKDDLMLYGNDVLKSEEMKQAFQQTHHQWSTVGEHTFRVAFSSVMICYALRKLNIKVSIPAVVVGALCHDLGILGRTGKFRNNRECCRQHPLDSVEAAKRICPDLDEKTEQIISRHMFPLTPKPPMNREGVIVTIADKYCSVKDRLVGPLLGGGQEKVVSDKIPTLKKADFLRAGQK